MKKFIPYLVVAASLAYYACLPLMVQADIVSFGATSTNNATTGTSAGTTLAVAPIIPIAATDTVVSVLSMRITAYASVPNETDDTPFITADGTHVSTGEVASNILPFGTKIEIPALFGNTVFTVHDRMSPRIKNTIDVWMPSVKQAIYFGMSHADVLVIGTPATSSLAVAN